MLSDDNVDVIALADKKTNVESWSPRNSSCSGHIWPLLVVGNWQCWCWVAGEETNGDSWTLRSTSGQYTASIPVYQCYNTLAIPVWEDYIRPIHLLGKVLYTVRITSCRQYIFYTTVHPPGMGTPAPLFERVMCNYCISLKLLCLQNKLAHSS